MPRVWLVPNMVGEVDIYTVPMADGMPVDMNASLLRQIEATNKKYETHQNLLRKFYDQAVNHPDHVRRVR